MSATTSSLFSPTQFSGCSLWLDGADSSSVTLSASTVTQWNDKSGNNRHATPTTTGPVYTLNSLNGLAAPVFNNSKMSTPSYTLSPTNRITAFIVSRQTGAACGGNSDILVASVGYQYFDIFNRTSVVASNAQLSLSGSGANFSSSNAIGINYLYGAVSDGTSVLGFLQGTQVISTATSGFSLNVSSGWDISPACFIGPVCEIIVYNTNAATTQRQQIEGYLAWKWGLVSVLPTNHPYKTTPVYSAGYLPYAPFPMQKMSIPVSVFMPTQISGCALWLDAADPNATGIAPANGAAIPIWIDKSGNRKNASVAAGTITFSSSARQLTFNGSSYYTLPNNTFPTGNTNYSLFIVSSSTLADYNWIIGVGVMTGGQAIQCVYYPTGAIENGWWSINITTSAGAVSANQSALLECIYSSPTLTTLVNGRSSASSSSLGTRNNPSGPTVIGTRIDSSPSNIIQALNGTLSEIILYPSGLTPSERQQVEGYLAWKWGLTASLPNGHPYKTPPIAPFSYGVRQSSLGRFSPLSITGCSLWLDAADPNGNGVLPANGAALTTWVNKGTGSITLSNPSTAPTYMANFQNTLGSVSFNNSYFQGSYSFNLSAKSAFLICSQSNNAVDSPQGFLSFYGADNDTVSSTNGYGYQASQGGFGSFGWLYNIFQGGAAGYYIAQGTAGALTPLAMYENVFSNQFEQTFVNGASYSNVTITTSPGIATTVRIGARIIGGTLRGVLYGNICEIIVFSRGIVSSERQQIEGYLAWKWGLVGSLPATHPYKMWPPPPS